MTPSSALLSPTPMQEGIWVDAQARPDRRDDPSARGAEDAGLHVVDARQVRGALSTQALRAALESLAERHDALRLRVRTIDGLPQLEFDPTMRPQVMWLGARAEAELVATFRPVAFQPFDLPRGPLLRVAVVELQGAWAMMLCGHQIILDGEALDLLWRDVLALYAAADAGVELALPPAGSFRQWVESFNARCRTGSFDEQLAYWQAQLSTPVPLLHLPEPDGAHTPSAAHGDHDAALLAVDERLYRAIAAQDANGVSPLAVVVAGLAALLYRYAGDADITIGHPCRVPVDDRAPCPAGSLSNLVVLRTPVAGECGFGALASASARIVDDALAHREVPFSHVVEALAPARRSRRDSFFQVVLSFEDARSVRGTRHDALATTPVPLGMASVGLADLIVHLRWSSGDASLQLKGTAGGVSRPMAEQMLRHLVSLIEAGLAMPSEPIDRLMFLSTSERQMLVEERAGPSMPVRPVTVVDAIAARSAAHPGRTAVSQGDVRLTYGQLWDAAGEVAAALQGRGIGAGDVVGVSLSRRPLLLATLLGIWRSGAAFVPLDPQFPVDRLRYMASDSACRLVIADTSVDWGVPVVMADALVGEAHSTGTAVRITADDLAYLIYTSGSTGRPKGVEVAHGALQNLLQSMATQPGCLPSDVMLAVTTLSFDIAGLELWMPLTVGAQVEIATGDELLDPRGLMRRLHDSKATIMQATPSTWRMLLAANWSGHLRLLLCGGEAFPVDLVAPLCARGDAVFNLYGPTETTIWSTLSPVEVPRHEHRVPIGRPIHNTRVYVVDAHGQLLPPGVTGELWIAGDGVAHGYHGQHELTRDRFLVDPFVADARVYRTGDLGRWTADGELLHLGRVDQQLKVSGYRIEAGEIESVLNAVPSIQQAVAAISGPLSDARLVAYVVFRSSATERPSPSELRRHLRRHLPDYMIPAMIVDLPEMPLTPNGKVDRRSLPDPFSGQARAVRRFEAPQTDVEIAIAKVWHELLGGAEVSRHDNFFERGGHSLLAVRAVWLLEHRHGIVLDPRSLFFGTMAQLAEGAR